MDDPFLFPIVLLCWVTDKSQWFMIGRYEIAKQPTTNIFAQMQFFRWMMYVLLQAALWRTPLELMLKSI